MRKNEYRNFESARKFVRELKFKKNKDWREYCKSHNKPNDIPTNPERNYKNEWISWPDFLGTKNTSSTHKGKQMTSFKEARKFVRELGLKSDHEWKQYCKSGNKPEYIPTNPDKFYKNAGWKSLPDWLGTGTIATKHRIYLPFKEARKFVRDLHLTGQKNWREYCTSGNKPDNIHTNPDKFYKNKGWITFGDWLGTGTIATKDRIYLPFKEARKIVHKLKLKNNAEWQKYCTSDKPDTIPSNPERQYKDYIDSGDWLGTGTIDNRKRSKSFLSAKEAKTILKKLFKEYGIKNLSDWNTFASDHKKLLEELHIPLDLLHFYSKENAIKRKKHK